MFTEVVKGFKTKNNIEPLWYLRLRAFCAIAGFVGAAVYFVLLLIDLSKGEIYIISSQMTIGQDGYNGSVPLPDSILALTYTFSNMTTNATCYAQSMNSTQESVGCNGILTEQIVDVASAYLAPDFNNPQLLSDHNQCIKGNSSGICSLIVEFQFPPVDPNIVDNYTISMELTISNTFHPSFLYSPYTIYNLGYGDILTIVFTWTKYYPITGDPYYINVQTSSRATTLNPGSTAAIILEYNTGTIMTNTEKYSSSFANVLSLVGGLYGGITSIFVVLFGMGVVSPWGILPKYLFRRYIVEELKDEYSVINTSDEVTCPLIDPLPVFLKEEVTPENFAFAEARLAKLESLLSRYYLDAEILKDPGYEDEKMYA